jgi:hypothetical protein
VGIAPTSQRRPASIQHSRALVVGLLALLVLAVWLITQSGGATVVSQTRPVAPFNAVELAGANVVTVSVGAPQSVVVRARQDEVNLVTTQVSGKTLVIANVPTRHTTKGPMSVSVRVPSLTSLSVPGSGVVNITGIRASSLTVTVGGSGLVNASGTATRLNVSVPGSGDVELGQLVARDVNAAVSGSGQIVVNATRSLDASVSGNGVIRYSGNPAQLTKSVTGSGAIIAG